MSAMRLRTPESGSAFQHLKHIVACDAGAKKALAIDLTDVSDFVANWRDRSDGRLKSLLSIRCRAQT